MKQGILLALLTPTLLGAQDVIVRGAGPGQGAAIIQQVIASPHTVVAGSGALVLPRDTIITGSLLVLGRPTYLASRVNGSVIVVGADLFLRPGVDVRGQAVAIGGTVAETTLGRVAERTLSLRDETYDVTREDGRYVLRHPSSIAYAAEPAIDLPGLSGLLIPAYDRVDGLSLPAAVSFFLAHRAIELQPSVTYRSRLGVVDPGLLLRVAPSQRVRLEAHAARATRTNDDWIYSDLINSLTTIFAGTDTRNYFRSDGGEARLIATIDRTDYLLEPYVGARLEHVRPITVTGDVWSIFGRTDSLGMRRPNPLVEDGDVRSAIAGVDVRSFAGAIVGRFTLEVEQSFTSPGATSNFLQLTANAAAEFPTFGAQSLRVKAHGVATRGDHVPRSRFAYLGGSGTLSSLNLLEEGGSALVYVENRYLIPIEAIQLPFVGAPVLTFRDAFGGAGVGSLPSLQHEIGAGIGLSAVHLDVNRGVAGRKRTNVSLSLSLTM